MPFVHTTDGTFNTVEPCLVLCIAIEPECNLAIFDPVSMDCFLGNLLLEVDLMATNLGHEQIVMVRTGNIYISKKKDHSTKMFNVWIELITSGRIDEIFVEKIVMDDSGPTQNLYVSEERNMDL